jgi:hypothetical protein
MEAKQAKGLMEAYASIYTNISESHFKVGDEVVCKKSGMEGEVVKLDKPDGKEDEKYYTVKREDGKKVKYAPNELKLAEEAKNGGVPKKKEEKFHTKLDKLVHNTFGSSPEEKKMKEEVETDLFDYLLEYLVAEGYADTNQAALSIMANMSEEWKQSIVEGDALRNTIKTLEGKRDAMNANKSGSANTAAPGKQSVGAATYKAYQRLRGV